MALVARIGDTGIGTCYCHKKSRTVTGTIIIGSSNIFANGKGRARIGDIVMCDCGHTATLIMGNSTVLSNNIPQSRMGDMFAGGCVIGTIISSSSNV